MGEFEEDLAGNQIAQRVLRRDEAARPAVGEQSLEVEAVVCAVHRHHLAALAFVDQPLPHHEQAVRRLVPAQDHAIPDIDPEVERRGEPLPLIQGQAIEGGDGEIESVGQNPLHEPAGE